MKKITIVISSLVMLSGFSACKKNDNTNPTNPSTTPAATTPTPANVSGALISVQVNYNYTNSALPIPVDLKFETGLALFFSSPGSTTYIDGGTVSVNSTNLDNSSNTYSKTILESQSASMLSFGSGSNWNVAGSGAVTAFSYTHTTAFPGYSGTLPTTVTKASGLTVSLSGISNADSVIVVLAAGNSSLTKTVAGSASSVTFSAAEISGFPTVTDNTGIIQVDPWKSTVVTKNSKDYAFIKEQANIGNININ